MLNGESRDGDDDDEEAWQDVLTDHCMSDESTTRQAVHP